MPPKRYKKVYSSWKPVKEGQVKEQQPYFDSLDYSDITITITIFDHVTSATSLPVISSSSFLQDSKLDSSAYSYNAGNSSFFFWKEALNCHLGERSAWYAEAQDKFYCIQIIEIDGMKWNQDFLQDMKNLMQHGLVGRDKADFEFLMAWHGFWGNSPPSTLEGNVNATAVRAQRLAKLWFEEICAKVPHVPTIDLVIDSAHQLNIVPPVKIVISDVG